MAGTTYPERLSAVKADVLTLTGRRDQLNREAGVEERRVQEAYDKLKALELVPSASSRLTASELEALRAEAQASLDATLVAIEVRLAEGKRLLADYDATAA
jgi:hypothetical protein